MNIDTREAQRLAHLEAKAKGFWPKVKAELSPADWMVKAALIGTEAHELMEAHRRDPYAECDKEGLELTAEAEECADIMIRLLDFAEARGINLGEATRLKFEYNRGREFQHGGCKA